MKIRLLPLALLSWACTWALISSPAHAQFIGKNKGYGIGPEITLPIASKSKLYGFVNARYLWESGVRSNVEGEMFLLTLTFPIPSVSLQ